MNYYLYSTRNVGWLTSSGTYSTDITQAASYARPEALTIAKRHKTSGGYQLLPVVCEDMDAI